MAFCEREIMFIALEGIDGAGKTTVAAHVENVLSNIYPNIEYFQKSSTDVSNSYVASRMKVLRRLVWPSDDGRQHALLGDQYWLHLVVAWFSLVTQGRFSETSTSLKFCDHWYYRFIAKFVLKGYSEDWLFELFAHVRAPDLIVLLDIDPRIAWKRRLAFKHQEMGFLDGFIDVGMDSYVNYQQQIRELLLDYGQRMNWIVVTQRPEMEIMDTAAKVVKEIVGRLNSSG
jgi:thymidylate kinase